ncbi:glycyl-radical enzyme activating protein [Bacillus sp. V3-13]|uniref:glycyl-radical enzyme activating protein n=1 Tax=Bacillus sp. V3-13 TaxID=2053728 RepID=UPI000C76AD4C|nr:glycyl-radical enzyme activating protein [Bacillus sp. V3-13]PLR77405.1 glycyl-radical enzyme activating protein [Bacillus sp. V3-13]
MGMIKGDLLNASSKDLENVKGTLTEIERYAIHDGPGIRSVIFLKGCPLRCAWCCNPETQQSYIEMAFFEDKCIGCRRCVSNCTFNAITVVDREMIVDRSICRKNCFGKTEKFPCTLECYSGARKAIGESMTVLDAYKEVIRDISFYEESGGGVTISGGEPMFQADFVYSMLRYCKDHWIDTAMETCGAGKLEDYKLVAPYLDVLFIDLKNLDGDKYKEWTTHDNTQVLVNIQKLSELSQIYGFKIYIRTPVIPGFNDSEQNILDIGNFIKDKCKGVQGIELLPYHKLGRGKYKSIGREYKLKDLEPPTNEYMDKLNNILLDLGISVFQF